MTDSLGNIDRFIDAINVASTHEEIFSCLTRQIDRLGFEYFAYELMWSAEGMYQSFYHTNYPSDWLRYYIEKRYCRDDIICRQTAQRAIPFLWTEVNIDRLLTAQQIKVMNECKEAGLISGASVPIHGPGKAEAYFVVAGRITEEEFEKLFLSRRHELHLIATYAHERILALKMPYSSKDGDGKLTPREIEIITLSALGKDRGDIAQILSIGEETVKRHVANACRKLDVYNKTHAVSRALIQGLIAL
jgi:DNA-binding CsgD family transcriptional regulator